MIHTSKLRTLSILASLLLGLSITTASIAQNTLPKPGGITKPVELIGRVLEVLDQVGVIIPGKGFNSIHLGQPLTQLVALWGEPKKIDKRNGFLAYQLDEKTVIQFFGKKWIQKIVITGLPGSLARVNNGVVFGMSPIQVLHRFNAAPNKKTDKTIRYSDQGIVLSFDKLSLREIEVFKP